MLIRGTMEKISFMFCQFNADNKLVDLIQAAYMTLDSAKMKNNLLKTSGANQYWLKESVAREKLANSIVDNILDAIKQPDDSSSPSSIPDGSKLRQFCDRVIDQARKLSAKDDLNIMEQSDMRSLALDSAPALAENLKRLLSEEKIADENN